MSKRSPGHTPRPRDYWPTPPKAVQPLLAHLTPGTVFCEPCAGNGALMDVLTAAGHRCAWAIDLEPQRSDIIPCDVFEWLPDAPLYITNPPWSRPILHRMIDLFPQSWLLFDADWMHTKQAAPYLPRCREIISVGRVRWIADSAMDGKDNCCWYRFDQNWRDGPRLLLTTPSETANPTS